MLAAHQLPSLPSLPSHFCGSRHPPSGPSRLYQQIAVRPIAAAIPEQTEPIASSFKLTNPPRPPSRTDRRFRCTHPGCDKAYLKPSRLAEHELTHTGEVNPFPLLNSSDADENFTETAYLSPLRADISSRFTSSCPSSDSSISGRQGV